MLDEATVNTNILTIISAGSSAANGTYVFNPAASVWTNAATTAVATNYSVNGLAIVFGTTNLYKSSNARSLLETSGSWGVGSGYTGTSPYPTNYFQRLVDYSKNNVMPTNLPAKSLTGLATNLVVPISAHVTNGLVTWTSP